MLAVLNTEQLENIRISGDYWDLKELQKAIEQLLHTSIENNCTNHVQKNYVLRFCRELEQAIEGEVAIETTYNGIYDELQEEFVIPFPQENIYFSFEKCWPKMLFTVLCLNHFIEETTTHKEQPFTQTHIMVIRKFESLVFECFTSKITLINKSQIATLFFSAPHDFRQFIAQYVDLTTAKYLALPQETKMIYLPHILKKFHIRDFEYTCFKNMLNRTAKESNLPIHRIVLQAD